MKLIFFDEAKNDNVYPHYHIGAICIDEEHLASIETRISAIAEAAFGTSKLSEATELHAANIYHRKKNFKDWNNFDKRIDIIIQFAHILSEDKVRLIDVQINCNSLRAEKAPAEIAFMFLCERANDLVKANQSLGMLIGDRESDHLAARFSTILSGYRTNGTHFTYGQDIHNLVDSVHFTHSHLSRFLQLADVYTWLLQFMHRNGKSNNKHHMALLQKLQQDGIDLGPSKYKEWPKS